MHNNSSIAANRTVAPPWEFIRTIFSAKIWMKTMLKKVEKLGGGNTQKIVHKLNKQQIEL